MFPFNLHNIECLRNIFNLNKTPSLSEYDSENNYQSWSSLLIRGVHSTQKIEFSVKILADKLNKTFNHKNF